jgi:hypothetical protein
MQPAWPAELLPNLLPPAARAHIVSMPPRAIVLAYALCTLVAWLLGITGVTRPPPPGYVALDVGLDVLVIAGLWLLWRTAWLFALVFTLLGEALGALHPKAHSALLIIGAVQLALLLNPQLRRHVRSRPTFRCRDGT